MRSLSSIVKARSVCVPLITDYYNADQIEKNAANSSAGGMRKPLSMEELQELEEESRKKREEILAQAEKKARQIESEAKKRAERLVEEAKNEGKTIKQDALAEGYEDGYLQGLSEGTSAAEKAAEAGLEELDGLVASIRKERETALLRQEKDLVNIAFEVAKKIMRQQIQTDENAVSKFLEDVIQENEGSIKIYLSEYQKTLDVHMDKSIIKKIRDLSRDARVVLVKEEDEIMVETENGMIDMSVPVQMAELKDAADHVSGR